MLTSANKEEILSGKAIATPIKSLGLKGRGVVFINDSDCVRLIDRASRFLRKDAEAFVAILAAASSSTKQTLNGYILVRRAPVCSKAKAWLNERGVTIEVIEDH